MLYFVRCLLVVKYYPIPLFFKCFPPSNMWIILFAVESRKEYFETK